MGLPSALVKLLKNGTKNGTKNGAAKAASRELAGPLLPKSGNFYPKPAKIGQFVEGKATNRKVLDPVQHEANAVKYINTKGKRNAGDVNFMDDKGNTFYMNKSGDDLQYSNLNVKKKNNTKLSGRRAADAYDQTLEPDADFYKDAPSKKDAHHIAGLDQWGWLYDGLNRGDKMALTAMLEKAGIPMGNNPFNRADLSSKVHSQLHSWMSSKGMNGRRKNALGNMPLEDRMEFVQQVIKEYKESLKKMFDLQMAEKHGEVWISPDQLNKSIQRLNQPELAVYDRS